MQQKIIPPDIKFRIIELDTYVQLPEIGAGDYFWGRNDPEALLPIGYETLSEWAETFAKSWLRDSLSSFTFRLFLLGHGTQNFASQGVKPIFETKCGVRRDKRPREGMVFHREIDNDYAMCVANDGCKRCQEVD